MLITNPSSWTAWSTLALDATPHLPGCPAFLIEEQIALAGREFFVQSTIWRSLQITLLTTVAGQAAYALTPPTNGELSRVHTAWNGSDEVAVEIGGQTEDYEPGSTDTEYVIGARAENTLFLSPAPTDAGVVLKGVVSYVPTAGGAGIPTSAYTRWRHGIASWAAAQLVIQAGKPWSNPGNRSALMARFSDAVHEASFEAGPVRRRGLRVRPV